MLLSQLINFKKINHWFLYRVFIMSYLWSCNALIYYAFSYNIGDYGGNFYAGIANGPTSRGGMGRGG